MLLLTLLAALVFGAGPALAKSVFAHFMLSNTQDYSQADYAYEFGLAQAAHIDGFAVNFAAAERTNDKLPTLFAAAESTGFKLFFSFDYAGGPRPWTKDEVRDLINRYASSGAYWRRGSQPLVSTFEGPKAAQDWPDIKAQTNCFFIPSWSSRGAKRAMDTGVPDGLFSWAAWPEGPNSIDTIVDASYLDFLGGKPYMMPVAPWFYTNMPGFAGKNWVWRGDSLWFDRWNEIWFFQPEFVQIISWNDYGESHYIGPLSNKESAYVAFDQDHGKSPFNYVKDMPHDSWRQFLPFVIDVYKSGTATITKEGVQAWYRLHPGAACTTGGTTGNTASQLQTEYPPSVILQDRVFYSALLGSSATVTVRIGGTSQAGTWTVVPDGGVGLYHGSVPFNGATGQVTVTITRGSATVASMAGASISGTCPESFNINNFNAWSGSALSPGSVSVRPPRTLDQQVCTKGTGRDNLKGLCEFACAYGYCPKGPCTCITMGEQLKERDATGVIGYPAAGLECIYEGLCSYACNRGYCPTGACSSDPSLKGKCIIPPPAVDPPEDDDPGSGGGDSCNLGTGPGNFLGLCDFSCNHGYCPSPCECTRRGTPVPASGGGTNGWPAPGLGLEYAELCSFTCANGYCPSTACVTSRPAIFIEVTPPETCPSPTQLVWMCHKSCAVAGDVILDPETRWKSVEADEFLLDAMAWYSIMEKVNALDPEISMMGHIALKYAGKHADGKYKIDIKGFNCQILGDNACKNAPTCGTTDYPALDLVFRSFSNVNRYYWQYSEALLAVKGNVTTFANSMVDAFVYKNDLDGFLEQFSTVLGFFGLAADVAGLSIWKHLLKSQIFDFITRSSEKASELNGLISSSIDLASDFGTSAFEESIQSASDLSEAVSAVIDAQRTGIDRFVKHIFSGFNTEGGWTLIDLLSDGKFLESPIAKVSKFEMEIALSTALIAQLIPIAWAGGDGQYPVVIFHDNKDIKNPFYPISVNPLPGQRPVPWASDDDAAATYWQWDNKAFWLFTVSPMGNHFHLLKGHDQLDKENNKWGVTWRQIIRSAYDGWVAGGKWPEFGLAKGSSFSTVSAPDNVLDPGFFNMPVCSHDVATRNIQFVSQHQRVACNRHPCCIVNCEIKSGIIDCSAPE